MTAPAAFLHAQSSSRHPLQLMRRASDSWALRLQFLSFGLVLSILLLIPVTGFAQANKPVPSASAAGNSKTFKATNSRPSWAELTPMQQQTLQPLAASWNRISETQKRKWLEISRNYHSLPPEGQATMHSRMSEWVALSPQQRAEARLNFAKTKELSRQLTPEEKKAKWQTYQALSPEEKQKLAAKAPPRPTGAALAVKPVSPQKLAAVPPHGTKPEAKAAPKIAPSQASKPQPPAGEIAPETAAATPPRH